MNAEEFRRIGYQIIDWVADYRSRLETFPVMSPVRPGDVRRQFPAEAPASGGHLPEALASLEKKILPGITHWNHPSFFAYFPSNTSYASVLADLLASGLGAQGMSWQTSPAATELEEVVMDWLRQIVGLSEAWTGVVHDTASTATLCALLCARERSSGFSQNGKGLQAGKAPLAVYASSQSHSSVEKDALLAGFGRDYLRLVDTDGNNALSMEALREAVDADLAGGLHPCALVATVGTTGTTALDPVAAMAELARKHGMWLHVDAALAGTAMALPECRWMWQGVEEADSLVFNPHKWMGVGFDFSAYFVRDARHLIRVMSTNPSYLLTAHDSEVKNFRDWHIPLGRRFRSLKLWFYLMDVGVGGLRTRLRRDLENTQWLKAQIEDAHDWELMAPVPLQTVCIRHVPPALENDDRALDRHNLKIARHINDSGKAYVTPSVLKGKQLIRISIGAETTERRHVEALWQTFQSTAAEMSTMRSQDLT